MQNENVKILVVESRIYSREDKYRFTQLLVRRSRAVGNQPAIYELSITDSHGKETRTAETSTSREKIIDKYLFYTNKALMAERGKECLWETPRKTNPVIVTEVYFSDDERDYWRATVEKLSGMECYFMLEKSYRPDPSECENSCSHTELCFNLTEALICYNWRFRTMF